MDGASADIRALVRIEYENMAQRLAALGPFVSLDQARETARLCSSYTRLPALLNLSWRMDREEWLTVLGEEWSVCDNIGAHASWLRSMLPRTGPVRAMMTAEERAAWKALPPRVTLYRGQRRRGLGFSWSLDRAVAARFPFGLRYKGGGDPVLITATVQRHNILALKLDREEAEAIVLRGREVVYREPLRAP